jgi:Glu-tRNA(Gln) amidotransferase subunit E-like FAD-binding protein
MIDKIVRRESTRFVVVADCSSVLRQLLAVFHAKPVDVTFLFPQKKSHQKKTLGCALFCERQW